MRLVFVFFIAFTLLNLVFLCLIAGFFYLLILLFLLRLNLLFFISFMLFISSLSVSSRESLDAGSWGGLWPLGALHLLSRLTWGVFICC